METSNPPETAPATDTEKIETVLDSKLSELNITDEIKLNSKPTTESTTIEQSPEVEPSAQEAVSSTREAAVELTESNSDENDDSASHSGSGSDESEPSSDTNPHPVVLENQVARKEKSPKSTDSRLAPVKKGEFFEHDNRSVAAVVEDGEAVDDSQPKLAMDKVGEESSGKEAGKKGQKGGSKWSHDLFESQEKAVGKKKQSSGKVAPRQGEKAVKVGAGKEGEVTAKKGERGLPLAEYLGEVGGGGEEKKGKQKAANKNKTEAISSGQQR